MPDQPLPTTADRLPGVAAAVVAMIHLLLLCVLASAPSLAGGEDMRLFRIGTGGEGGTYFPIGTLLAQVISAGVGCQASSCGRAPPLVVAQVSNGSVSNVENMAAGRLEAGLVQADIAHWAYRGTESFAHRGAVTELRAIASLYAESVHLVARAESGIESVADLRGKRVSLDEPGSGTLVDASAVLRAFSLSAGDLEARYLKPKFAAASLAEGSLDAYFVVAGYPTASVQQALADGARLVPIEGPPVSSLLRDYPFFATGVIPAGAYHGRVDTPTLTVGAQLLVTAEAEEDMVYALTRAIWDPSARSLLDSGHPQGKEIRRGSALSGLVIPLHPGARRYYRQSVPEALAALEAGR